MNDPELYHAASIIITLAVPISQESELPLQNWIWTWSFIVVAIVATLLAVPLYGLVPVCYSSICCVHCHGISSVCLTASLLDLCWAASSRKEKAH